jgi:hypothetical protein
MFSDNVPLITKSSEKMLHLAQYFGTRRRQTLKILPEGSFFFSLSPYLLDCSQRFPRIYAFAIFGTRHDDEQQLLPISGLLCTCLRYLRYAAISAPPFPFSSSSMRALAMANGERGVVSFSRAPQRNLLPAISHSRAVDAHTKLYVRSIYRRLALRRQPPGENRSAQVL